MNAIASIHQKILDKFIQIRQRDPEFSFAPRKINNKERLSEGYWFLGNERYVHVSFWNGTDWKQKIHNIGFVVWDNKHFAIELVAQDREEKRPLLLAITKAIPGFKKDPSKFKWYKHYEGIDYLVGLENFLENEKPIIDHLVMRYQASGIKMITPSYTKKYVDNVIRLRLQQKDFGKANKITRLTWNTTHYMRPSGPVGKSIHDISYEARTGYGHEEWLLDRSKIIDGYHYGFIQALNISTDRHVGNSYNITLFTTNDEGGFYLVGEIKEVECIDEETSENIYALYKKWGWLNAMEKDITAVGADLEKFKDTPADIFFNVRFRFENASILGEMEKIDSADVNLTTLHFKLLPKRTSDLKRDHILLDDLRRNETDPVKKKNTRTRTKTFNVDCSYDPYHDMMQNELCDLLRSGYEGYRGVRPEKSFVDIRAKKDGEWHFFEIKTDAPKLCIRKALGQVMEYAFFPDNDYAQRLIVIGEDEPDESVRLYLRRIRKEFKLPLYYRAFNRSDRKLSIEY